MFTRQNLSWCVLSRVIKLYSNTASSVVCEQSNTRLPKKIFTISDLSAIQNSFDKKCNNSEQNGEGQSHHSVLKCFMVAGLVGINQTKSKDDELEQGGEEKIIHMIKLAKLSQEVFKTLEHLFSSVFMLYTLQIFRGKNSRKLNSFCILHCEPPMNSNIMKHRNT